MSISTLDLTQRKNNNWAGTQRRIIRVFAVLLKTLLILGYQHSSLRRHYQTLWMRRLFWCLRWAHMQSCSVTNTTNAIWVWRLRGNLALHSVNITVYNCSMFHSTLPFAERCSLWQQHNVIQICQILKNKIRWNDVMQENADEVKLQILQWLNAKPFILFTGLKTKWILSSFLVVKLASFSQKYVW